LVARAGVAYRVAAVAAVAGSDVTALGIRIRSATPDTADAATGTAAAGVAATHAATDAAT
jgi:hypothetical protein